MLEETTRLVANTNSKQCHSGAYSMEEILPGAFNAAGLMVPSIIPLPMPFIDDVAGTLAAYMVAKVGHLWLAMATVKAPKVLMRQSAVSNKALSWRRGHRSTDFYVDFKGMRELSHAGQSRKEGLGPLFPGTI